MKRSSFSTGALTIPRLYFRRAASERRAGRPTAIGIVPDLIVVILWASVSYGE